MTEKTLTPRKQIVTARAGAGFIITTPDIVHGSRGLTKAEMYAMLNIPGLTESAVFWNGHEFEICGLKLLHDNSNPQQGWEVRMWHNNFAERTAEYVMQVYFPIDPRTNEKDWRGAKHAYANETNTGWLPEHCKPEHHHDHELRLMDVVMAVFQPEIDQVALDSQTALATLVRSNDSSARSRELAARLKLSHMYTVRSHVLACAEKGARGRWIGWYHQHPEQSHIHKEVADCIDEVLSDPPTGHDVAYATVTTEHPHQAAGDPCLRDPVGAGSAAEGRTRGPGAEGGEADTGAESRRERRPGVRYAVRQVRGCRPSYVHGYQ